MGGADARFGSRPDVAPPSQQDIVRAGDGAADSSAIAYVWGALSPVAAFTSILETGVMRLISPEAFDAFTRALMGGVGPDMFAGVEAALKESFGLGGVVLALWRPTC